MWDRLEGGRLASRTLSEGRDDVRLMAIASGQWLIPATSPKALLHSGRR